MDDRKISWIISYIQRLTFILNIVPIVSSMSFARENAKFLLKFPMNSKMI